MARKFLKKCDDVIARGQKLDNVSEYLCGHSDGSLRSHWIAWVNEGTMSSDLLTEITAYQSVIIDDSFQETPHAIFTRILKHAPASLPPWWSACFRFKQNQEVKKLLDSLIPGRFSMYFRNPRMLYSMKTPHTCNRTFNPRGIHCQGNNLLKRVYRLDEHSVVSLKPAKRVQTSLQALSDEITGNDLNNEAAMLRDFLSLSLTENSIYSINHAAVAITDGRTQYDRSVDTTEPIVFKVSSVRAVRFKTVKTPSRRSMIRSMRLPVMIQPMHIWRYNGNPVELDFVYSFGPPAFKDVLDLARTTDLLHSIHEWTTAPESDLSGTTHIVSPQLLTQKQWYSL